MHDLYPDVLVMAGLLKPQSLLAKAMHAFNAPMFRTLDAVVIIGRDTEKLLLRYPGMTSDKIMGDACARRSPHRADNPYRRSLSARYVVGLSGNLRLYPRSRHRVRSRTPLAPVVGLGSGVRPVEGHAGRSKLPNVTLVDRVEDEQLETFLSAANAWIIPYRKNVAGVSVPSKPVLQSLAIGRPVILVSEVDRRGGIDGDRARRRLGRRARQSR